MAINYTWEIGECEVYPTKSSKSNVIHNVHWRINATDDANNDSDGNPQFATVYGSQDLDTTDLSNFVNWSSLNAAQVQAFVEAAMGADEVARYKSILDAEIAQKVSPTSVTKTLG